MSAKLRTMIVELKDPELPPRRKLKRAEYDHLVALGAFDDERIELLYGELMPMSPQGPTHRWLATRLDRLLSAALDGRAAVQCHSPVIAAGESQPEPDVAVFKREEDRPGTLARTIHLIIEVADTSRARDLRLKRRLYAESGFPEYWVFDLVNRVVHVHRDPRDNDYHDVTVHAPDPGAALRPLQFPDLELELAPLFPTS